MADGVKTVLLMWSGGVSSTALLLELLTERKYKRVNIAVHHVRLQDLLDRSRAEALACKRILEYVENKKKYRKFFFSESLHEYTFMRPPNYSRGIVAPDMVAFMAANMCVGKPSIETVMYGGTSTEIDQNSDYPSLLERAGSVFASVLAGTEHAENLKMEYPLIDDEFPDIFDELPRALKKLAFSCLFPTYDDDREAVPCGECGKCKQRDQ